MPMTTSHSLLSTREASVSGSRSSSRDTASDDAISSGVRCLMKTGFPRHLTCVLWMRQRRGDGVASMAWRWGGACARARREDGIELGGELVRHRRDASLEWRG